MANGCQWVKYTPSPAIGMKRHMQVAFCTSLCILSTHICASNTATTNNIWPFVTFFSYQNQANGAIYSIWRSFMSVTIRSVHLIVCVSRFSVNTNFMTHIEKGRLNDSKWCLISSSIATKNILILNIPREENLLKFSQYIPIRNETRPNISRMTGPQKRQYERVSEKW